MKQLLEVSGLFHLLKVFHLLNKNVSFVVFHLLISRTYLPCARGGAADLPGPFLGDSSDSLSFCVESTSFRICSARSRRACASTAIPVVALVRPSCDALIRVASQRGAQELTASLARAARRPTPLVLCGRGAREVA